MKNSSNYTHKSPQLTNPTVHPQNHQHPPTETRADLQTFATALRLHRLTVPELQDYREHATLACEYELISNKLNSVKWYKDGSEFFRYAPMQQPTVSMFKVAGIHVHNNSIDCDTQSCRIQLWYLQPQSSGVYRCEVSGDAPDFKLVSRVANMTVGGKYSAGMAQVCSFRPNVERSLWGAGMP